MRIISEQEFSEAISSVLVDAPYWIGAVTGPGRSGAIAAVYASHILRVPFIPYGAVAPECLGAILVIDTAAQSGRTLRKAGRKYSYANPICIAVFNEPPRVAFWYEACNPKPQHYRQGNDNVPRSEAA